MAYVSLYRKYRPARFGEMVGQKYVVRTLKNTVLSGNISHAYLFTGSRGTGKTSAAKIFARALNCLSPLEDGSPCGKCRVCGELANPNHPDVVEIDAASNNGVDEIRTLRENVSYMPVAGKYKVFIIDEVHMLSGSAFNALLKTLEEPPEHVVFILATTEVHKIPATILSRCIRLDFRLLTTEELAAHLGRILDDMGRPYRKEAVRLIAEAGDGSARDMLSVADMCLSYCEGEITYEDVLEVTGAASPVHMLRLAGDIAEGSVRNALQTVEQLCALGKSSEQIAKDCAKMLRNLVYIKNCADADRVLQMPADLFQEASYYANRCSNEKLVRAAEIFLGLSGDMRYSSSPKLLLEMAAVRACDVTVSIDTEGILLRLKEMESRLRKNAEEALGVETVWGYLLNKLRAAGEAAAYTYASGVTLDRLLFRDNTLYINGKSEGEVSGLRYYLADYEKILCERFFDIVKVALSVDKTEDEVAQGLEEMAELVGKDKLIVPGEK